MYANILVSLDGSSFAETALSHATTLASKFESKLTLVKVFETPHVYQFAADLGCLKRHSCGRNKRSIRLFGGGESRPHG